MNRVDGFEDDEMYCKQCGSSAVWHDCENCEEGFSHHDCGEDTCCCQYPENNVICDICKGDSGWWACPSCNNQLTPTTRGKGGKV